MSDELNYNNRFNNYNGTNINSQVTNNFDNKNNNYVSKIIDDLKEKYKDNFKIIPILLVANVAIGKTELIKSLILYFFKNIYSIAKFWGDFFVLPAENDKDGEIYNHYFRQIQNSTNDKTSDSNQKELSFVLNNIPFNQDGDNTKNNVIIVVFDVSGETFLSPEKISSNKLLMNNLKYIQDMIFLVDLDSLINIDQGFEYNNIRVLKNCIDVIKSQNKEINNIQILVNKLDRKENIKYFETYDGNIIFSQDVPVINNIDDYIKKIKANSIITANVLKTLSPGFYNFVISSFKNVSFVPISLLIEEDDKSNKNEPIKSFAPRNLIDFLINLFIFNGLKPMNLNYRKAEIRKPEPEKKQPIISKDQGKKHKKRFPLFRLVFSIFFISIFAVIGLYCYINDLYPKTAVNIYINEQSNIYARNISDSIDYLGNISGFSNDLNIFKIKQFIISKEGFADITITPTFPYFYDKMIDLEMENVNLIESTSDLIVSNLNDRTFIPVLLSDRSFSEFSIYTNIEVINRQNSPFFGFSILDSKENNPKYPYFRFVFTNNKIEFISKNKNIGFYDLNNKSGFFNKDIKISFFNKILKIYNDSNIIEVDITKINPEYRYNPDGYIKFFLYNCELKIDKINIYEHKEITKYF